VPYGRGGLLRKHCVQGMQCRASSSPGAALEKTPFGLHVRLSPAGREDVTATTPCVSSSAHQRRPTCVRFILCTSRASGSLCHRCQ